MKLWLLASAGGAIGAGARYLVGVGVSRWLGAAPTFPWATLCVNVVGSFLMGILIEAWALRFQGSLEIRTFFAVGILGGFTTFSAFSLELSNMLARKQEFLAAVYALSSVTLSVLALIAGMLVVRAVLT